MMEFTFDGIVRQGFGFYNPNHAAALICAIFPFLWGWKKYAWIGWILTFLLTIPLVMTYSRTGVLVLEFELAAYFILNKKLEIYCRHCRRNFADFTYRGNLRSFRY